MEQLFFSLLFKLSWLLTLKNTELFLLEAKGRIRAPRTVNHSVSLFSPSFALTQFGMFGVSIF